MTFAAKIMKKMDDNKTNHTRTEITFVKVLCKQFDYRIYNVFCCVCKLKAEMKSLFVIMYQTKDKKESDRTVLLIYSQPTYLYFYIIPEQILCFRGFPGNRL